MTDDLVLHAGPPAAAAARSALRKAVLLAIETEDPTHVERWWRAWIEDTAITSVIDCGAAASYSHGAPAFRVLHDGHAAELLVHEALRNGEGLTLLDLGERGGAWESLLALAIIRAVPRPL